jgi:fucose permease
VVVRTYLGLASVLVLVVALVWLRRTRLVEAASGILCVAIVGGAVVPLMTGHAADWVGLKAALLVPAICYSGILSFGLHARHPKP